MAEVDLHKRTTVSLCDSQEEIIILDEKTAVSAKDKTALVKKSMPAHQKAPGTLQIRSAYIAAIACVNKLKPSQVYLLTHSALVQKDAAVIYIEPVDTVRECVPNFFRTLFHC
uniref:Ku domain-containing protein n=1 Tax=Steinernema glaseri TaxID=37863 RepID=A0A1I8AHP6_9BILA